MRKNWSWISPCEDIAEMYEQKLSSGSLDDRGQGWICVLGHCRFGADEFDWFVTEMMHKFRNDQVMFCKLFMFKL